MVTEAVMRTKCNKFLTKICSKNYPNLSEPIELIHKAVVAAGFDPEQLEGFYCGRDGRCHDQIGAKTWLTLSWHKFENVNRWEVNAYVS